jgi:serine/threonine protein kinase
MTGTGNAIGTFQYMAPERLGGSADDARADIYALACVLYECLTGDPPFPGSNMASLVAAHLNAPPPKPSTARSDVPEQLDQVIATGMAKDPDERYATTVELSTAAHDAITAPIQQTIKPATIESTPLTPAPIADADTISPSLPGPTAPQGHPPTPSGVPHAAAVAPPSHPASSTAPTQLGEAASPTQETPPQPPTRTPRAPRAWWKRPVVLLSAVLAIVLAATVTVYVQQHAATVYVADQGKSRVVKVAAGSTTLGGAALFHRPQISVGCGGRPLGERLRR